MITFKHIRGSVDSMTSQGSGVPRVTVGKYWHEFKKDGKGWNRGCVSLVIRN